MTSRRMPLTHPGRSIRDSMEAMGWTVTECARHLGIPREHLSRAAERAHRHITRDGAIVGAHRLEQRQVLATPASLLRSRPGAPPTDGCITARREPALSALDLLAAVLFLALLAIADEQMWAFQQDKKRRIATGERVVQPFHRSGLRRFSRHPDYLAEIGMWSAIYLFAVAASGQWLHWSALGCVGLTLPPPGTRTTRSYQASTPALTSPSAPGAGSTACTCCITTPDAGSPERTCTPRPRYRPTSARPASMGSTLAAISPAL